MELTGINSPVAQGNLRPVQHLRDSEEVVVRANLTIKYAFILRYDRRMFALSLSNRPVHFVAKGGSSSRPAILRKAFAEKPALQTDLVSAVLFVISPRTGLAKFGAILRDSSPCLESLA